jgi:hypothetical protein
MKLVMVELLAISGEMKERRSFMVLVVGRVLV